MEVGRLGPSDYFGKSHKNMNVSVNIFNRRVKPKIKFHGIKKVQKRYIYIIILIFIIEYIYLIQSQQKKILIRRYCI